MQGSIRAAQESLNSNERTLHSTLDKATSDGLNAVMRVAAERNISGVYGPLVSLIDCDDQFMTAVEVTAGKSLFHVVVDTDDTASKVIEIMNEQRLGRVRTPCPLYTYTLTDSLFDVLLSLAGSLSLHTLTRTHSHAH